MPTRRAWLVHCSLAALASPALAALPAANSGAATAARDGPRPTLLVVGDSLSAEYGLVRGSGWVALLQRRLAASHPSWRVVNASISGDTTSGGRSRLPTLLKQHRPQVVVVELGGNDALRGLPLDLTRDNLAAMVRAAKAAGARAVLAGIVVPPNYGRAYGERFGNLFGSVARAEGAALVPSFLAGVADIADATRLFQADGIHPTADAQPRLLDNVWPVIEPLLRG